MKSLERIVPSQGLPGGEPSVRGKSTSELVGQLSRLGSRGTLEEQPDLELEDLRQAVQWENLLGEMRRGQRPLTVEYWRDEGWFVGRLREVPSVLTQGETVAELLVNIPDAYDMVCADLGDAPEGEVDDSRFGLPAQPWILEIRL